MATYRKAAGQGPDHATNAALHREKTIAYAEILAMSGLQARPGILQLVEEGLAKGRRLAIATTTSLGIVQALRRCLWRRDAEQVFAIKATREQVTAKRPASDIYLLALQCLGLQPESCIALEGSCDEVLSARAAVLRVVVAPSLYT